ncbi:glycosyltransferase family 4 protein [Pigmentibacter sp. JX0631]|uniref:glycosyltransferase family 4 protein n=1 Tax=Pigmentibacter sp. JX0631 TaxID=2976982 RepID=UPI0024698FFF|nr:glycosyltransferase family 4 protein [Pigmentibacter sp. JX0631]WGL60850.1 glycosyltransferase family 4 protein [Pigmentibacter sp. JX0631]
MKINIAFIINNTNFFLSHRINIAREVLKLNGEVTLFAPEITKKEEKILNNYNINFHYLPFSRQRIRLIDLLRIFILGFKISKLDKIFHLVTIIPIIFCGIPLRLLNKKVVFAVSGLGTIFISQAIYARTIKFFVILVYRFLFNGKNSRLIVQNTVDFDFFKNKLKIRDKNLYLIKGSGVSQFDFNYFEDLPNNRQFPVILVPARLIKEKGIYEICNASKLLLEENFPHEVWISGDIDSGNPSSLTKQEVEQISLAVPSVKFLGYQQNMKDLYKQATMVCLPSYREGLPKALIEAAACGRPIITSNVPGCNEIVEDMKTGILVNVKSVEGLRTAIKKLYLNKELMEQLRLNAYNKFLLEYNEEIIVKKIINLYSSF